ncbi:MAG: adenylosuccinate synthase, partial [Bdellovibrionota bacterium]
EIESLQAAQVLSSTPWERIRVSERAHVILPYHRQIDRLREDHASKTKSKIGTTVRGIGPAYEDKAARRGIQVIDLLHPNVLKSRLMNAIEEKNVLLKHHFDAPPIELNTVFEDCLKLGERLRPYVEDTRIRLAAALASNRRILFEGGQGTLLDVDHGTYPFVTSSNTVAGAVLTGCGLGPRALGAVIGITKAYTTRVGTGPFPTEIETTERETAERIRKVGAEFGATTGRMRRVGWLDLVALKYAAEVNHLTGIALMKSDCLSDLPEIRVCVEYRVRGRTLNHWPSCVEDLEALEPVYETLPGWKSFRSPKSMADLPIEFASFVKKIETFVGLPIVLLSTGPGREETYEILDPFLQ